MQFHKLKIEKKVLETLDTMTVYFNVPPDLKDVFEFKPGQYLTISEEIGGKEVRRSYSICTAPYSGQLATTIKRVAGGNMSTFIHSNWHAEGEANVSEAEGKFILMANPLAKRKIYFIAAGSGITPIMSMIRELLENEPASEMHLLYGSRDEDNIIFKEELDKLAERHAGQLFVTYTLSQPKKEKGKGLTSIFKKSKSSWQGEQGRIDGQMLKKWTSNISNTDLAYICGPGNLIEQCEENLLSLGMKESQIFKEYFSPPGDDKKVEKRDGVRSNVTVHLNGKTIEFETDGSKPILDELIAMRVNPPYSCTSGACSTCLAKVSKGQVKMDVCYALDEDEIAEGYILTCQAKPVTDELELSYIN